MTPGNRRYLPMTCGPVDCEAIEKNRSQLWAEALHTFKENGIMWQQAELARKVHDNFRVMIRGRTCWRTIWSWITTRQSAGFRDREALSRLGMDMGRVGNSQHNRLHANHDAVRVQRKAGLGSTAGRAVCPPKG
jgi:predicted P-loop ATPase